jgi:hypothetical protein
MLRLQSGNLESLGLAPSSSSSVSSSSSSSSSFGSSSSSSSGGGGGGGDNGSGNGKGLDDGNGNGNGNGHGNDNGNGNGNGNDSGNGDDGNNSTVLVVRQLKQTLVSNVEMIRKMFAVEQRLRAELDDAEEDNGALVVENNRLRAAQVRVRACVCVVGGWALVGAWVDRWVVG